MRHVVSKVVLVIVSLLMIANVAGAEPVKVTFAGGFSIERFFGDMIAKFEAAHPEIDVEFVPVQAPVNEWILVRESGGVHIDVIPFLPELVSEDIYRPLDDYLARDANVVDFDDFLPTAADVNEVDGVQFGIPFWGDHWGAIHYQRQHFVEAGLSTPYEYARRGDWSFEALAEAAKRLTRLNSDGSFARVGLNSTMTHPNLMSAWLWSYGGEFYTEDGTRAVINTPQSINALESVRSLIANGVLDLSRQPLTGDHVSMKLWHLSAGLRFLDAWGENYDYITLPPGPVESRNLPMWYDGYAINRRSDQPEAAWELIKFLSLAEQEAIYVRSPLGGALPARKSVLPVWMETRAGMGAQGGEFMGEVLATRTRIAPSLVVPDREDYNTMSNLVVIPVSSLEVPPREAAENAAALIND